MKNRTNEVITCAKQALLKRLQRAGVTTKKHVLDNEYSTQLKELIQDTCKLDLMLPGCHHCNIAEVAIKVFKQHFLGVLTGFPDDFPWSLWDRLLPQIETTLNLLRQSNEKPTASVYAHMYGNLNYNRMPLAPIGCPCHVHVKLDNCNTWDFHTLKGYDLFTSGNHYRTHNMFMKDTKAKQMLDTLNFLRRHITHLVIRHADRVINAMAWFVKTVDGMTRNSTTLAKKNEANMKDLKLLAKTAGHITSDHPEIAGQRVTTEISQPIRSANRNPHIQTDSHPVIKQLRRASRLNKPTQSDMEIREACMAQLQQSRATLRV